MEKELHFEGFNSSFKDREFDWISESLHLSGSTSFSLLSFILVRNKGMLAGLKVCVMLKNCGGSGF